MRVYEKPSAENTAPTLTLAIDKAKELSCDIILSTTSGASALTALAMAKDAEFTGKLIVITHVYGMREPGMNSLSDDDRQTLEDGGVAVVTAGHAFGGIERAISGKYSGVYPVEIMAQTLKMLSAGVKVCVEIGAMALDAGKAAHDRPSVVIGGTGRGLDTVCVMTPGYSSKIFDTKIHEILCKPY